MGFWREQEHLFNSLEMKTLHLSTGDNLGGASRATYRLHQGLQARGITSEMLVQEKASRDKSIHAPVRRSQRILISTRPIWDALPLRVYPNFNRSCVFSIQWLPERVTSHVKKIQPDIINLHWIAEGFIQIETLAKFKQPMVWTLHDMWAFTGGCHYSDACERFTQTCGSCPQLGTSRSRDLSNWIWRRKSNAWQELNLTLICPTHWLAGEARRSSLFHSVPIEVIPNGLNLSTFRPLDQHQARELLNLPQFRQLVLFGSMAGTGDRRKGFDLLQGALKQLSQSQQHPQLELVIFGKSRPENPPDLGFPTHYLGQLRDDLSLALAYSAADVMIVPSRQENLAQTATEALACGTPVVTFAQTGPADVVKHHQNGYLAQPGDIDSLAQGIAWVLETPERLKTLSELARQLAEQQLGIEQMADAYIALYSKILARK
jgi:glycosyltransferase involved in cell wall biosynthesis